MSQYVGCIVIPVSKQKMAAYREMAKKSADLWKEHGALQ